jgi:hypothetical protein
MLKRRNVKRSKEQWRKLIAEQRLSGKTQEEYCRDSGVSKTTFWKWSQRLNSEKLPKFIELNRSADAEDRKQAKLEVEIAGGITLRIWS